MPLKIKNTMISELLSVDISSGKHTINRMSFDSKTGFHDYNVNSERDLVYLSSKIDEATKDTLVIDVLSNGKLLKVNISDSLSWKSLIQSNIANDSNKSFAQISAEEKDRVRQNKNRRINRPVPTPDGSRPHNGFCGHCREKLPIHEIHCPNCGAFWGVGAYLGEARANNISALLTSITVAGIYLIFTINASGNTLFTLIVLGLAIIPVCFYWFVYGIIGVFLTIGSSGHNWYKKIT
jgi:hypothetical protein